MKQTKYTVNYYYDGKFFIGVSDITTYGKKITTYTDTINMPGYKLDRTENLPLTVKEDAKENIINVYYVKDNFNYTVNYYKDSISKENFLNKAHV